MNRRSLLKLIGVGSMVPGALKALTTGPFKELGDDDEFDDGFNEWENCPHKNVKVITQADMDEDMHRRGDIVCSGSVVFYNPGKYCLDCGVRVDD